MDISRKCRQYTWNERDILGRGSFGYVCRGLNEETNEEVAVKVYDATRCGNRVEDVERLRRFHCDYTVAYYDAGDVEGNYPFKVIIMELAGTSVSYELKKPENRYGLPKEQFIVLVEHCVRALECLDREGIAHRDLKPANIVIGREKELTFKITDFGLSRDACPEMTSIVGTPAFMPSVLVRNLVCVKKGIPVKFFLSTYTKDQFDLWSAACCFFYCATNRHPFIPKEAERNEINYYIAMDEMYKGRSDNIVCARYNNETKKNEYFNYLPHQHCSYSRSYRRILEKFFKLLFNKKSEYLHMQAFASLCREMNGLKKHLYYCSNCLSMEEYYDTSDSDHFDRTNFAETLRADAIEMHVDLQGGVVKILNGFMPVNANEINSFIPASDGNTCNTVVAFSNDSGGASSAEFAIRDVNDGELIPDFRTHKAVKQTIYKIRSLIPTLRSFFMAYAVALPVYKSCIDRAKQISDWYPAVKNKFCHANKLSDDVDFLTGLQQLLAAEYLQTIFEHTPHCRDTFTAFENTFDAELSKIDLEDAAIDRSTVSEQFQNQLLQDARANRTADVSELRSAIDQFKRFLGSLFGERIYLEQDPRNMETVAEHLASIRETSQRIYGPTLRCWKHSEALLIVTSEAERAAKQWIGTKAAEAVIKMYDFFQLARENGIRLQ